MYFVFLLPFYTLIEKFLEFEAINVVAEVLVKIIIRNSHEICFYGTKVFLRLTTRAIQFMRQVSCV